MDAGYGVDERLRRGIGGLGLAYVAGVLPTITLWPAQRPCVRAEVRHARALARALPPSAWERVAWREGSNDWLCSRYARLRVRTAHAGRGAPGEEEWLLIDWPEDAPEPAGYWLSTLPADIDLRAMVDRTQLRWRIERDYQELKQELGLGHYEGRGWRGFHHHASLCIAAYGFLVAERCLFPPRRQFIRERIETPALPAGFRPRGAAHPA